MRLLFVHGINQQGKSSAALRDVWVRDLETGLGRPGALAGITVDQPFYGDVLHQLSRARAESLEEGVAGEEDLVAAAEEAAFLEAGLREQAQAAGAGEEMIAEAIQAEAAPFGGPDAEGFPMDRRINAIVGVLERLSPLRGNLALMLLGQAHAYLKRPAVGAAVDALVRPALATGEPTVVVAHSLGTVVTFRLLRALAAEGTPATVPLYVTLGSPLTLEAVQGALGGPFARPPGVARWVNARDPDDFISLNRGLLPPRFTGGIENLGDVDNRGEDPHAIPGYLAWPPVARLVGDALGIA
jgi:hypothetical protein